MVQVGHDFTTPVFQTGYPKYARDENDNWTRDESFYIRKDLRDSYIPAVGSMDGEGYLSSTVNIEEGVPGFPDICRVDIHYKKFSFSESYNNDGYGSKVTQESTVNRVEKKIEEHPGWKSLTAEEQATLKGYAPTFVLVTVVYRRVEEVQKSSYKFRESDIIKNVNVIENPEGLLNASANKWMKTARTMRWTKGENLVITDTWQYDEYEWRGTVTPNSNLADILAWLDAEGN